jgi:hypothetical protein
LLRITRQISGDRSRGTRRKIAATASGFRIPASGSPTAANSDDLVAKGGRLRQPHLAHNRLPERIADQTLLVCHDSDAPKSKRVLHRD